MHLPTAVIRVAEACRSAGGRAWVVGGSVRDHLLGRPVKDHDIEVHGLAADDLVRVLRALGRVDEVGRSFGVFKVTIGRTTLDVGLPRRDSNAGPGHRGIRVEGDPFMGVQEAARRRDLTINAILLDPLSGEVLDPYGGREDLARGRLRAVDRDTFLDDPLRALRVVQFAGRFEMLPDDELVELCRAAPLEELPAERVSGEIEKLLLAARRPSLGLVFARQADILARVLPQVAACSAPAVDAAVDRAAALRDEAGAEPRPLALMLGALLHAVGPDGAEACLEALKVHTRARYPLRSRVVGAVASWPRLAKGADDTTLRTLAEDQEVALVALLAHAATGSEAPLQALSQARLLGVEHAPLPAMVLGRDLEAFGVAPGPGMGVLLARVRAAQLAGRIHSRAEALDLAQRLVNDEPSPGSP